MTTIKLDPGAALLLDALHGAAMRPTLWAAVSGTACWGWTPTIGTSAPAPARSR